MRIVISSPDGIGDFVLREPLWAELAARGHQILFLTRASTCAAAKAIVPSALSWEIPEDPYDNFARLDSPNLATFQRRLQQYSPDLVVVAPFVHTWFDVWLVAALQNVPSVGFAGRMYPAGVASLASPLVEQLTRVAHVAIDAAETTKNHALANAIFKSDIGWRSSQLTASLSAQQQIQARLQQRNWLPGKFYVACVGDGPRNQHINWPIAHWAELIRHALQRHAWRVVLIGDCDERATNREIIRLVGANSNNLLCLDEPPLSFVELTAILSLGQGYVGRDSGPMHIAAALGKPVFSVFAGGCWPCFLPTAASGKAFAMPVPCAGCGNFCHLPACYCIRELPLEPVMQGLDAFANSPGSELEVVAVQRSATLAERMEREAAAAGREYLWQLSRQVQSAPSTKNALVDYGGGWYAPESAAGAVFRWMGRRAEVSFACEGNEPQRLHCRVEHTIHPQSRSTLQLRVDGQNVPIIWNEDEPQCWSALVPAESTGCSNRLVVELSATAFRPSDFSPASDDRRWLSLAISELRLEPFDAAAGSSISSSKQQAP